MGSVHRAVLSKPVILRKTEARGLDAVLKMEDDARPWVSGWSREQHPGAVKDPDAEHRVLEDPATGQPLGCVILRASNPPRLRRTKRVS